MKLAGAPNDIIQNLNPIAILVMIPMLDRGIYPGLRKLGVNLSPIRRMLVGYFAAAASMVAAAVMQHYIYKTSPCGYSASDEGCEAPIIVWAQFAPVSVYPRPGVVGDTRPMAPLLEAGPTGLLADGTSCQTLPILRSGTPTPTQQPPLSTSPPRAPDIC